MTSKLRLKAIPVSHEMLTVGGEVSSLTMKCKSTVPRLPDAIRTAQAPPDDQEISRFPREELEHMPGSQTTPGLAVLGLIVTVCMAFRYRGISAPGMNPSRLNGWPVPPPADASPPTSRSTAHGSGPMWFAKPSS
jgi:hypothetical protein